jgi:signal transduction histidine kinase
MDFEAINFHLADVVNTMAQPLKQNSKEKGISIAVQIGRDVSKDIIGDLLRLGRVLINLSRREN